MPKTKVEVYDKDQLIYPYIESDHVTFSNGMKVSEMLDQSISMLTVTHEDLSFKVGVGDQDVSSAIVDSSVSKMVIKGQTYQNILPEPSTHVLTNNKEMFKVNEGLDPNVEIVDGVSKSAILSGNTLMNLIPEGRQSTFHINNVSGGGYAFWNSPNVNMIKPSTKYLVLTNVTLNTGSRIVINNNEEYISCFTDGIYYEPNEVGIKKTILTSKSDLSGCTTILRSYTHMVGEAKGTIQVFEYQEGMENWDIPYFEGMTSVKAPVLTTIGKNLFDINQHFKTGNIGGNGSTLEGEYVGGNWQVSDFIKLNSNTDYYLSTNNFRFEKISFYDVNKKIIKGIGVMGINKRIISTSNNIGYIRLVIQKTDGGALSYNELVANNDIQLEQGRQATSYEPYKSNILSTPKDLELRGIGDVQDTLDCLTGDKVERIGEIVLDGSEAWTYGGVNSNETIALFYLKLDDNGKRKPSINDKLPSIGGYSVNFGEGVYVDSDINIRIKRDKLNGSTVDDFKQWLSQNPITLQYQLATESIKTVDLNVVDQNNIKIDKINVFNETTHVNASSDELTPTVNISKSVSYPTIIKPNTKYTVDLKRNDKPLTVNLGGTEVAFSDGETRKTITTPSTLTNDKLSYYGVGAKCNEIMLIEGEIERNIDYFTGMQSVVMQNQMPILTTVGKNLLNLNNYTIRYGVENLIKNDDSFTLDIIDGWGGIQFKDLKLKPNTNYTFKFETNKSTVIGFAKISGQENQGGKTEFTFTTDNTGLITLTIEATSPTSSITLSNIQLEEGTVTTPYEPYKSSILSYNDDVTLRGIGDVQDTLNCNTGEMTVNINEKVLNGSENWNLSYVDRVPLVELNLMNDARPKNEDTFKCDKLPIMKGIYSSNSNKGICFVSGSDGNYSLLRIRTQEIIDGQTLAEFKKWLSDNPTTIQYQTKPTVKALNLSITDQDGNVIPKMKSYKDVTHLEVTVPKQSLLPHVSAEVATDNSKDMSSLTIKHQEISETQSAIQDNIQSQSDEIDTALMATTEIFESILE